MKKQIKYLIFILLIIIIIFIIIIASKTNNKNKLNNVQIDNKVEKPDEKYTKVKERYECNEFTYTNVSIETLLLTYFNKYKNDIIEDVEKAYNTLDLEYREKRFGSVDAYKEYVDKNYDKISTSNLKSYKSLEENNEYNRYMVIDNNGNSYIFKETAIMEYTLILDTYTMDLPEFIEKYNSTNNQGKCALNLQKFIQAINAGDYKFAYNSLSSGFRNNYFKTQTDFEKYAKESFYVNNSVNYSTFETKGDIYTYKLELTDAENAKSEKITKTFIVKLRRRNKF